MPMEAVTLTASWSFAPWAAIRVERSAQVTAFQQDEKDQNRVRYGAEHTIAIQNTGGEPLTRFVLQDAALSGEGDYTCKIHGEVVTPAMSYDPESGTFAVELPGVLPAGGTLAITFAEGGSALGENGIFTLQGQVGGQAWGMFMVLGDVRPPRQGGEVRSIRSVLVGHGALGANMSGTGPTVFGLFDDPDRARAAWEELRQTYRAAFLTETV